jgi:trimethylamine-N-oxide reductase cytochrome c-type subunit TorC
MGTKPGILILILLISTILMVKGYQFYKYTKTEPAFCSTCHLMEEGFRDWRKSKHSHIICQRCHQLSLLEENKLLIAFTLKGSWKAPQEHGAIKPWQSCLDCHMQEAAQGSRTLRSSYGHARHVFMQDISCEACHIGNIHNFGADSRLCQKCHKDKLVHGMGMAGLYCLNCHNFAEPKDKMVTQQRCFRCHSNVPTEGVMARVKCFDCHRPHGRLKIESKDCLGTCHGNETRVGRHGKHLRLTPLECIDCHKPHTWIVDKKQAQTLCTRCHEYKDPMSFIY